jgi:pyruvate,water dikinase
VEPSTLDEIARASQEARDALEAYLRMFGWRMVSTYDVNGRTLCELPDSIVASVRAVRGERFTDTVDINSIRVRIPAGERPRFDDLLERARTVAGFEDDNAGITFMWRLGLARRCLLEAGARLVARGAIAGREDVFEATLDEITGLLDGTAVPTKADLALRTAERVRRESEDVPPVIGAEEDLPIDRMPPVLAARVAAMLTLLELGMSTEADELAGSGIGTEAYRGVARVAVDPVDAISRLEPGDVLVVPYTTPAFSTVMVMAGALVVESGGPLIHAAVLAREFGIPAVVGARGAVTAISDGDEVEVDPVAGRIRVVTRAR